MKIEPRLPEASAPLALAQLHTAARGYASASKAANTWRTYATQWKQFEAWATAQGAPALPASPDVVALYLVHLAEAGSRPSTLDVVLAAIGRAHELAGHPSPRHSARVREIRAGIRRTKGTAPQQVDPLALVDLRELVRGLGDGLRDVRDRALLLLGWAGALRRSELAVIEVEHLHPARRGVVIFLPRSKTDQEGAGREVPILRGREDTCPIKAVEAWISRAGLERGPLWRAVRGVKVYGEKALTGREVARILQRRTADAGIKGRLSGHSLRAGFITSAAIQGSPEWAIQAQTGHRSTDVLRGYIRRANLFDQHAGEGLL